MDLENQKELFKLELEKINLQHQNEMEKIKVDSNNQLTNSLASGFMNTLFSNPNSFKELMRLSQEFSSNKNDKK